MDIKLSTSQITEAIEFYLAFKGFTSTRAVYKMEHGDLSVIIENLRQRTFDEEGLLHNIKRQNL